MPAQPTTHTSTPPLQQHGANFFMMAGELALNSIPVSLPAAGWHGVWASVYGLWSAAYFLRHGRAIYPFLDVKRPNAWLGYVFMVLAAWLAHGVVQTGILLRDGVHRRLGLHPKRQQ